MVRRGTSINGPNWEKRCWSSASPVAYGIIPTKSLCEFAPAMPFPAPDVPVLVLGITEAGGVVSLPGADIPGAPAPIG